MNKQRTALIALRTLLAILIILNMALIFHFSAQNANKSTQTSNKVGISFTNGVGQAYDDKPPAEKENFHNHFMPILRKCAHAIEFGTLASLVYFLLLTWKGGIVRKYFIAVGFAVLYAASDEFHQYFVDGRAMSIKDVGIDSIGIVTCATLILGVALLLHKRRNRA